MICQLYREHMDDPPAVLMIDWGTTYFDAGETAEGIELLFFITPENHRRFADKLLDHSSARDLVLTDPA